MHLHFDFTQNCHLHQPRYEEKWLSVKRVHSPLNSVHTPCPTTQQDDLSTPQRHPRVTGEQIEKGPEGEIGEQKIDKSFKTHGYVVTHQR